MTTKRNPPVVVVQIQQIKGTVSRHDISFFRVLKSISYPLAPVHDIAFSSFVFYPKFRRVNSDCMRLAGATNSGEQTESIVVETDDKELAGVTI